MLILNNKTKYYDNVVKKPLFLYKGNNSKKLRYPTEEYIKLIFRMKKKDFIYIIILMSFFFKMLFFDSFFSYSVKYNNFNYIIKINKNDENFYYISLLLKFFYLCEDEDIVTKRYQGEISTFGKLTYKVFVKDIFLFIFELVRLKFYFFSNKSLIVFLYVFLRTIYYTQQKIELSFKYAYKYSFIKNIKEYKNLMKIL